MASQSALVPYSVSGCSKTPAGPLANTVPAAAMRAAYSATGRVADVDELLVDGQVGDRDLDAGAVLDAGEVGRQHDLVAVLGEDRLATPSTNCSSWLARMNSMDGAPMSTPLGGEHDVGHQAGGEHRVDDAVRQGGGHHREGLLDLGAAEHEDAGPRRLLAQAREVRVLLLEEPAHGRRQQLLEADQRGLRAVRGGEGVADVEVGERRQLAHHAASSPGPPARARAWSRRA